MCGRFTLQTPADEIRDLFLLEEAPALTPRYNIAPTQDVAAVVRPAADEPRELVMLRWGLIPFFAKDARSGARMINARAETVATRPAFRDAFRRRRCLVVADGFYEWKRAGRVKQPYHFRLRDGGPLAFAGLHERWRAPDGAAVRSCTIITTEANALVAGCHDRMPVILAPEDFEAWLDPGIASPDLLTALLAPYPAESMAARRVSRRVNSPANDDAACLREEGE